MRASAKGIFESILLLQRCYYRTFVMYYILKPKITELGRRNITGAISLFLNITGAIAPVAPVLNTPLYLRLKNWKKDSFKFSCQFANSVKLDGNTRSCFV